ncbi:hypothetical protein DRP05_04935 [Archaeoglobales archaeon]|nr:MAG: hypothetical protein DRP05_04935 [Archaeoglobales archaeon]
MVIEEILEQKKKFEKVLSKYGVKELEKIERKIERGELSEYPTYEGFLSVFALRSSIITILGSVEYGKESDQL